MGQRLAAGDAQHCRGAALEILDVRTSCARFRPNWLRMKRANTSPAAVIRMPRARRSNNGAPSSSSMSMIRRLTRRRRHIEMVSAAFRIELTARDLVEILRETEDAAWRRPFILSDSLFNNGPAENRRWIAALAMR